MPWLSDYTKRAVQRLAHFAPRAERQTASGLAASYGLDPTFTHAGIKNISSTGIYLVTEKRLRTGELITLQLLEEESEPENSSELKISVHARVARQGEDGIGLSFVLPPGLDTNLWGVLVRNIVVLTDQAQIAHMFRTLRTILFLCRICQSGAEEAIILLGGQLEPDRNERIIKITLGAENQLASEPDADRMRAHSKLVASILKEGSWSNDEVLIKLWTGLLVSSCSVDTQSDGNAAPDDSNQALANLLIHVSPTHAKIFIYACERALDSRPGDENSPSASIVLNTDEMATLTGQPDLTRVATEVSYLYYLGLIQKLFPSSSYREIESFDITPTSLGLELFRHCHGHRGKIGPHLVEAASTNLRNLFPSTSSSSSS